MKVSIDKVVQSRYFVVRPAYGAYASVAPVSCWAAVARQDESNDTKADYAEACLGLLILNLYYPTVFKAWGAKDLIYMHIHMSMLAMKGAQKKGSIENPTVMAHGSLSDEKEALQEACGTAIRSVARSVMGKWSEIGDSEVAKHEKLIEQEETNPIRSRSAEGGEGECSRYGGRQ